MRLQRVDAVFSEEEEDLWSGARTRSEVVQSRITGDWVLYFVPKNGKPRDYPTVVRRARRVRVHERDPLDPQCPFCVGNENLCGNEIARLEKDAQWTARCFLNRFPIFHSFEDTDQQCARGKMEVLVACRRHDECLAQYSHGHTYHLIKLWRARYIALFSLEDSRHVTMFLNHGQRAGGSLQHAHFQTVAIAFVPPRLLSFFPVCTTLQNNNNGHHKHYCPLCQPIPENRIVHQNKYCIAFADVAPYSGSIFIAPKRCMSRISLATDLELRDFASSLRKVVRASYSAYDDPDFNLSIYNAPKGFVGSFHWFCLYVPHLTEDCSGAIIQYGMACSAIYPEKAAATLRNHIIAKSAFSSDSSSSDSDNEARSSSLSFRGDRD